MLRELSIRNVAIIDDLSSTFSHGLTIFSGETGAGKSIIINAVNLLLGGRATSKLIRTGADNAELEAVFEIDPESHAADRMARHGYDAAEGLLIRRIISRNDRHRIYINGRLATIQILKNITENLASISGQHAHQGLLKEDQHLLLLDKYGGLLPLRSRIHKRFHEMAPLVKTLDDLRAGRDRQDERRELLEFQKKEILAASVTPGEDEALARERARLHNAQSLHQTVNSCLETLYDTRGAVVERLMAVKRDLEAATGKDPILSEATEILAGSVIEIEDAVASLRTYLNGLRIDAQRLEAVEERLDVLHKLKRKHGGNLDAVIARLTSIDEALSGMDNATRGIKDIETLLSIHHDKLAADVRRLSAKRRQAAEGLSGKVVKELATLKMSPTIFEVKVLSGPEQEGTDPYLTVDGSIVTDSGIDRAAFLIAPNIGEPLKSLTAIASGGELSRVVLALKVILAKADSVETVVFDEVDAGIGGGVAEVVGRKLATLTSHHQVICITHLPQIARFGDHHFNVTKQVLDGRTCTVIHPLNREERVAEIARMLGGETITPTTLVHARELLKK